jgi:hypothetical protein
MVLQSRERVETVKKTRPVSDVSLAELSEMCVHSAMGHHSQAFKAENFKR